MEIAITKRLVDDLNCSRQMGLTNSGKA